MRLGCHSEFQLLKATSRKNRYNDRQTQWAVLAKEDHLTPGGTELCCSLTYIHMTFSYIKVMLCKHIKYIRLLPRISPAFCENVITLSVDRMINPLSTKLWLSDLKTHFVPRSKHALLWF